MGYGKQGGMGGESEVMGCVLAEKKSGRNDNG